MMHKLALLFTLSLGLTPPLLAQTRRMPTAATSPSPKYSRTPNGFLMVLRPGDNVLHELEQLAVREKIPSASFTGFGFVHPTFGFWDASKKDYNPKSFRNTELASMTGSIAWKDDKPALHVHGVVTDQNFVAYGGHILALEVSTGSVEITIVVQPQRLTREVDESTGAAVLKL
ncbi:PPC domain-containing DNA-binding protein [Hymenobacter norwichensis]|uniref:PPC domain-containing DNA-binding protein n=1 Tax=Hymenobacter norwichensis TaxID=223903 RepID=UPI0003B67724|nr:PPC domain-containing DNA-binding protein [Hymenobacter norwichensis]